VAGGKGEIKSVQLARPLEIKDHCVSDIVLRHSKALNESSPDSLFFSQPSDFTPDPQRADI